MWHTVVVDLQQPLPYQNDQDMAMSCNTEWISLHAGYIDMFIVASCLLGRFVAHFTFCDLSIDANLYPSI